MTEPARMVPIDARIAQLRYQLGMSMFAAYYGGGRSVVHDDIENMKTETKRLFALAAFGIKEIPAGDVG